MEQRIQELMENIAVESTRLIKYNSADGYIPLNEVRKYFYTYKTIISICELVDSSIVMDYLNKNLELTSEAKELLLVELLKNTDEMPDLNGLDETKLISPLLAKKENRKNVLNNAYYRNFVNESGNYRLLEKKMNILKYKANTYINMVLLDFPESETVRKICDVRINEKGIAEESMLRLSLVFNETLIQICELMKTASNMVNFLRKNPYLGNDMNYRNCEMPSMDLIMNPQDFSDLNEEYLDFTTLTPSAYQMENMPRDLEEKIDAYLALQFQ